MNPLRSLSPVRGLALLMALLILALSLTVFAPQSADALPACGLHRWYYRDQTKTVLVGHSLHTCSGGTLLEHWGTTSPYVTTQYYCCSDVKL
jgi:hypothetical protein